MSTELTVRNSHQAAVPPTRRGSTLIGVMNSQAVGVIITLVLLALVCFVVAPGTLRQGSFDSMLPLAGALAIAAAGQTLVVQQRGFDISVPATMSMTAYVCARSVAAGYSLVLTVSLCMITVLLIGVLNGLLVTRLAITPLIATLASNALVTGGVWTLSTGLPLETPQGLGDFVRASQFGIPVVALIAVFVVALLQAFQSCTTRGLRFLIAGASPPVARVVGIDPRRQELLSYVVSAACAGLAGVLVSGYAGSVTTTLGEPFLLPVVAAVIVGGTPLRGGAGSVVASGLAALFLTQLVQLTLAFGAPTSSQLLVQSGAIVAAVLVRRILGDRTRRDGT